MNGYAMVCNSTAKYVQYYYIVLTHVKTVNLVKKYALIILGPLFLLGLYVFKLLLKIYFYYLQYIHFIHDKSQYHGLAKKRVQQTLLAVRLCVYDCNLR